MKKKQRAERFGLQVRGPWDRGSQPANTEQRAPSASPCACACACEAASAVLRARSCTSHLLVRCPALQVPVSKEEFEAKKKKRAERFAAAAAAAGGGDGAATKAGTGMTEEQKKKLEERAKR